MNFIIIGSGSDYNQIMWSDIQKLENCKFLLNPSAINNKFLYYFYHLHFSFNIKRKLNLPFKRFWRKYYSLEQIKIDPNEEYCIVFNDVALGRYDENYLNKFTKLNNVHLVLMLVNTMERMKPIIGSHLKYFDSIYTFDQNDSKKFQFIYYPTMYSKINYELSDNKKSDAFFVGVAKKRLPLLKSIFRKLNESGVNCRFYISKVRKSQTANDGIIYNNWLSYEDVLQYVIGSNCIIEVLDQNQVGGTLRMFEAICYNKKILTNNQLIKESKYYNPNFMQIFESVDDINPNFITSDIKVDYKYDNTFSPINFIKELESKFKTHQ